MSDYDEIKAYNTNPLSSDTDGDGLKDGDEINYSANPRDSDSDSDGLKDGDEVLKYGSSPIDRDTDDDGLDDGYEVMSVGTSPVHADTDGDKLNDKDEIEVYRTNPTKTDSDNDELNDYQEIQKELDPRNPDTDGDGVVDGRDVVPNSEASLVVDVTYWEEKKSADTLSSGDPYFIAYVYDSEGKEIGEDKLGPFSDEGKIEDAGSLWIDIPDDERTFVIVLQAWDSDGSWSSDEHYDINEDLHEYDLTIVYKVDQGCVLEKHDGSLDGSTKDLDGLIEFKIYASSYGIIWSPD